MDTITVCMGSSCFSRNSAAAVDVINRFVEKHQLTDRVDVKGSLCLCDGACSQGPNIYINDKLIIGVSPQTLEETLAHELEIAP